MWVQRNKFLVLYYIKLHNEHVAMGSTDYLNAHKHKFDFKRKAKPYACSTKRIMKEKSMKRVKKNMKPVRIEDEATLKARLVSQVIDFVGNCVGEGSAVFLAELEFFSYSACL